MKKPLSAAYLSKLTMKPDIFMDDFERTVWADAHYAAIGRALTFATRFEALCKTLNAMLSVKSKNFLDSEDDIRDFVEHIYKCSLAQHITSIAGNENTLSLILNNARIARNEIAHEFTLGLDRSIDSIPEPYVQKLMERLKELAKSLAEADRIISLILSVVTHEYIPNREFLEDYPQLIEKWVTDVGEIA
jgi:hypothetical protein